MALFQRNREFEQNISRWATLPAGRGRISVDELLELEEEALFNAYFGFAEFWHAERGWEHTKYSKLFADRNVIEVGSGFGFDGLIYSKTASSYTYVDINIKQIDFLKRIVSLVSEKLSAPITNIHYELLTDPMNQQFKRKFNAFYSHGVLHHVPFEFAQAEYKNFDKQLEIGSPIVLLMYPKERWLDCGQPPFETFGNFTDGGCPWAEYYDEEKIKNLVGPNYELKETIPWGAHNREFVNFELVKIK